MVGVQRTIGRLKPQREQTTPRRRPKPEPPHPKPHLHSLPHHRHLQAAICTSSICSGSQSPHGSKIVPAAARAPAQPSLASYSLHNASTCRGGSTKQKIPKPYLPVKRNGCGYAALAPQRPTAQPLPPSRSNDGHFYRSLPTPKSHLGINTRRIAERPFQNTLDCDTELAKRRFEEPRLPEGTRDLSVSSTEAFKRIHRLWTLYCDPYQRLIDKNGVRSR